MNSQQVAEAVPVASLSQWIRSNVSTASGPITVSHLSGGSSNLTFRVQDDANDWVLRRPPVGAFLATANDMGREYRVQTGLQNTDVPVPRTVAMCEDESIIGVPFYLMDFVDGIVYSDTDQVAHLDETQALAASDELIDVLARLHAVDFEAVGLGQLGKPAGFLERQVNRWCTQWEKSKQRELPAIDEVAERLKRSIPAHTDASVVHGDYSFNNTMWSRTDPSKMVAVLDWEMSTLGDPLTDLGMVSVYWGEAGALMWRSRSPQPHRLNPGFPSGDHLLARYEATSGRSLRDIDVYRVLAVFKLSIITEGALARIKATRPDDDTTSTENTIAELAELALDLANASSVASLRG
ncbi:MAG: phosphotransferase family protein [Actinobacteria bacterium]|jgi:aminoglycoside phosphotransferase (APT) family kinase protein|nr:phosphotransferase family protein [Actinomycetota bacterium]